MAGKPQIAWPAAREVADKTIELGSVALAAKHYGVSDHSMRRFLRDNGLKDEVYASFRRIEANAIEGPSEEDLLKERNRELERALRKREAEEVAEERLVRRLEAVIPGSKAKYRPPPKRQRSPGPHEFVLLFSDTHAGEVVSPRETMGVNEYDWPIMLDRMRRLQEKVLSYQQHRPYPIERLHVLFLGDMLSGSIHEELAQTNELGDAEATVQFGQDAAAWLEGFAPYFREIRVAGVVGNHPRRAKKQPAKGVANNDDWIAYRIIELLLRDNPQFSFEFPQAGYAAVEIAGRRLLMMHGDGIRSSMPGVPWGGVMRRVTTLQAQFQQAGMPIDYVTLGHFHTSNAVEGVGVKVFLNGSVKGVDEYSLRAFGSGHGPRQLLLTFHRDHGVTDVSFLDLDGAAAQARVA